MSRGCPESRFRGLLSGGHGKNHGETAAFLPAVGHGYGAAVKFDQLFCDAQAEAEVLFFTSSGIGLIESVKNIRFARVRNAAALIFYLEDQGIFMSGLSRADKGTKPDITSGRCVVSSIVQKD